MEGERKLHQTSKNGWEGAGRLPFHDLHHLHKGWGGGMGGMPYEREREGGQERGRGRGEFSISFDNDGSTVCKNLLLLSRE